MENAYSGVTNSIRNKYDIGDIQTAYWKAKDLLVVGTKGITDNGKNLYDKAKSYQKFVTSDLVTMSVKSQIDMSQAQITSNRSTNKYIIGPITITYPEYEDISYLKSIYLKTNEDNLLKSKTLIYDENNEDFEIEFIVNKVSAYNGLKK